MCRSAAGIITLRHFHLWMAALNIVLIAMSLPSVFDHVGDDYAHMAHCSMTVLRFCVPTCTAPLLPHARCMPLLSCSTPFHSSVCHWWRSVSALLSLLPFTCSHLSTQSLEFGVMFSTCCSIIVQVLLYARFDCDTGTLLVPTVEVCSWKFCVTYFLGSSVSINFHVWVPPLLVASHEFVWLVHGFVIGSHTGTSFTTSSWHNLTVSRWDLCGSSTAMSLNRTAAT